MNRRDELINCRLTSVNRFLSTIKEGILDDERFRRDRVNYYEGRLINEFGFVSIQGLRKEREYRM